MKRSVTAQDGSGWLGDPNGKCGHQPATKTAVIVPGDLWQRVLKALQASTEVNRFSEGLRDELAGTCRTLVSDLSVGECGRFAVGRLEDVVENCRGLLADLETCDECPMCHASRFDGEDHASDCALVAVSSALSTVVAP